MYRLTKESFVWRKRLISCHSSITQVVIPGTRILRSSTITSEEEIVLLKKDVFKSKNQSVFPWRHSPKLLLRLIPSQEEYSPYGPEIFVPSFWYKRLFLYILSARALKMSWFDICTMRWEESMCEEFTKAFSKAVVGIVSNQFQVTNNNQQKEANFNFEYGSSSSEKENTNNHQVDLMLEKNLVDVYKNAITNAKKRYQIRLQTRPLFGKLVSINFIPLSRLHDTPDIKRNYRKLLKKLESLENNESVTSVDEEILELSATIQKRGAPFHSTIIAQVSFQCKEIFWVKEIETGQVIQGDEQNLEKDVVHMVRFEIPITHYDSKMHLWESGSWQITDWDDLIDGNVFF